MFHIVEFLGRPLNSTGNAGITAGPTREEFKVWPRHVLITLKTIVETSIGFIVWLSIYPARDTQLEYD